MKTSKQIIAASIVSVFAILNVEAQVTVKTKEMKTNYSNELEVVNQLSTQSAVVNMPVTRLLNAPGNEALKAFFFTPVKDATVLKGKKIAVLAADGFEEIELTGPVWYFKQLGASVDIVAPRFVPAPE